MCNYSIRVESAIDGAASFSCIYELWHALGFVMSRRADTSYGVTASRYSKADGGSQLQYYWYPGARLMVSGRCCVNPPFWTDVVRAGRRTVSPGLAALCRRSCTVIHADRGNVGARAAAARVATVTSQRRQEINRRRERVDDYYTMSSCIVVRLSVPVTLTLTLTHL